MAKLAIIKLIMDKWIMVKLNVPKLTMVKTYTINKLWLIKHH
jgi:hypothetical protein